MKREPGATIGVSMNGDLLKKPKLNTCRFLCLCPCSCWLIFSYSDEQVKFPVRNVSVAFGNELLHSDESENP